MTAPYNYKNCQSLFGYAFDVHIRSAGTYQLCGCGGSDLTFDLWRQMTVEHIIGKKQGGYLKDIRLVVADRFPELSPGDREILSRAIDAANTVTACSFCNSATSQHSCHIDMRDLIRASSGHPHEVVEQITAALQPVLDQKRADVQWKLASVRCEFESRFISMLAAPQRVAS